MAPARFAFPCGSESRACLAFAPVLFSPQSTAAGSPRDGRASASPVLYALPMVELHSRERRLGRKSPLECGERPKSIGQLTRRVLGNAGDTPEHPNGASSRRCLPLPLGPRWPDARVHQLAAGRWRLQLLYEQHEEQERLLEVHHPEDVEAPQLLVEHRRHRVSLNSSARDRSRTSTITRAIEPPWRAPEQQTASTQNVQDFLCPGARHPPAVLTNPGRAIRAKAAPRTQTSPRAAQTGTGICTTPCGWRPRTRGAFAI